jgi:hypothetical protein
MTDCTYNSLERTCISLIATTSINGATSLILEKSGKKGSEIYKLQNGKIKMKGFYLQNNINI